MNALFLMGVLGGAANFITGVGSAVAEQGAARRKASALKKRQELLSNQIKKIQSFVEENRYSPESIDEAVGRLATIYDNAGTQIRTSIESGTEAAIANMQTAYDWSVEDLNQQLEEFKDVMGKESTRFQKTWKQGFDKAQASMVRRRLAGSEANISFGRKSLKDLTKGQKEIAEKRGKVQEEFGRQKARLAQQLMLNKKTAQQQAAAELARQLGGLELRKGESEEQARSRMENINRVLSQYGLERTLEGERASSLLGLQREELLSQAPGGVAGIVNTLLGGLAGAAPGVGQAAAGSQLSKEQAAQILGGKFGGV